MRKDTDTMDQTRQYSGLSHDGAHTHSGASHDS